MAKQLGLQASDSSYKAGQHNTAPSLLPFSSCKAAHKPTPERNKVWAGDTTYIKTSIGWVNLATVIGLYNRSIRYGIPWIGRHLIAAL